MGWTELPELELTASTPATEPAEEVRLAVSESEGRLPDARVECVRRPAVDVTASYVGDGTMSGTRAEDCESDEGWWTVSTDEDSVCQHGDDGKERCYSVYDQAPMSTG